jgi:carbon-monoxide dehydrogenase medium subunit
MKAANFAYHRPETVKEAATLLDEYGDDAKILAGGQSLVPMLAMRLTSFENLVDISRVAELQSIDLEDDVVRIGAGTPHAFVGMDDEVADSVPLLTLSTPHIGHFQIRTRGTLGGAIAHADPAAEYAAVALTLDA